MKSRVFEGIFNENLIEIWNAENLIKNYITMNINSFSYHKCTRNAFYIRLIRKLTAEIKQNILLLISVEVQTTHRAVQGWGAHSESRNLIEAEWWSSLHWQLCFWRWGPRSWRIWEHIWTLCRTEKSSLGLRELSHYSVWATVVPKQTSEK